MEDLDSWLDSMEGLTDGVDPTLTADDVDPLVDLPPLVDGDTEIPDLSWPCQPGSLEAEVAIAAAGDGRKEAVLPSQSKSEKSKYIFQDDLNDPLKAIQEARGPQLRALRSCSLFTGLGAEKAGKEATGAADQACFSADLKSESWWWILKSWVDDVSCHFTDVRELVETGSGWCCRHGQVCSIVHLEPGDIEDFDAGVVCRPYTNARTGRRQLGSKNHADRDLLAKTMSFIVRYRPRKGRIENVFGFVQADTANEPSALQEFVGELEVETCNEYDWAIFVFTGTTHMWMPRRRVYICIFHRESCGKLAVFRTECMVKVSPLLLLLLRKL